MNGIYLYFSSSIDLLCSLLVSALAEEQQDRAVDIFEPSVVVVPNPALRRWLQLEAARQNGIAANIRFSFLEQGLWDLLTALKPDLQASMIDISCMQSLVFYHLVQLLPDEGNGLFHLFRTFVSPGNSSTDEQRAWQLSGMLAGLFMEYEIHRPEMILCWKEGKSWLPSDHGAGSLEDAQRLLYTGVLQSAEAACSRGSVLLTLPALALRVLPQKLPSCPEDRGQAGQLSLRRPVHIFCPSQLSRFHMELICRLGQFYDIRLYSLNVCREFWEDVETPGERMWRLRKMEAITVGDGDQELPGPEDNENPLLAAWGKPGRETLKIFSDLEERFSNTGVHVQPVWCDDYAGLDGSGTQGADTVLERLKHAINTRSSRPVSGPQDKSLQIASAPGIEREVEAVWNSIVANMEEKRDLKFSDILVLVPDMQRYRAVIQQVFDTPVEAGAARLVPWSLIDSSASLESVYAQGVSALLGIISGEFTRAELFLLFQNPCFMEQWSVDTAGVETWLEWCTDINIFRGIDTPMEACFQTSDRDDSDNAPHPSPLPRRFGWRPGLKRLRLGKVMDGLSPDGPRAFGGLMPHPRQGSDSALSATLSLAVESLAAWRRQMRYASRPAAWWREKIPELIDEFLAVPSDMRAEEGVRKGFMEGIDGLSLFDGMPQSITLSMRGVLEYIRGILGGIPGGYGGYITGGVTVASLLPMRPIPFRHVYVLGLDLESFPGADPANPLDLTRRRREIGDVSIPERNAYLFLETLMTVRERLFLSWVGRDVKQDRVYEPSSVITALCDFMDFDFKVTEIPLKAWSPRYLMHDRSEPHNWMCRFSPHHHNLSLLELPDELRPEAGDVADFSDRDLGHDEILPAVTQVDEGEASGPEPPDDAMHDQIYQHGLVEFLKNPALFWIRRHMGLRLPAEDDAMVEDEPFELDYFGRAEVFSRAVISTLDDMMRSGSVPDYEDLDKTVRSVMSEMASFWRSPVMIYESMEHDRMVSEVDTLFSNEEFRGLLSRLGRCGIRSVTNIQIGDGMPHGPASLKFPPAVTLNGLVFHGSAACGLMKEDRLCGVVVPAYAQDAGIRLSVSVLDAFMFYCICVAGGIVDAGEEFILLSLSPGGAGAFKAVFRAGPEAGGLSSAQQVSDYLEKVAKDMDQAVSDMIPLKIIEKVKFPKGVQDVGGKCAMDVDDHVITPEIARMYRSLFVDHVEEKLLGTGFNQDWYAELYNLVRPSVPEDVFYKVRKRFRPLWLLMQEEES